MKLEIEFTEQTVVAVNSSAFVMIVSLYRTLGITLRTIRADYDRVW